MNGYIIARDTDGTIVSGLHNTLESANRDCETISRVATSNGWLVRKMSYDDYLKEVWS